MIYGIHQEDIDLLKNAGISDDDMQHSIKVAGKALESRFEEILRTYPTYGKNEITLNRYLGYHREIQGLMNKPDDKSIHTDHLCKIRS